MQERWRKLKVSSSLWWNLTSWKTFLEMKKTCDWTFVCWRRAVTAQPLNAAPQKKRSSPETASSATDRDRSPPARPLLWMIIYGAAFQDCTVACWVAGEAPHPSLLTSAFIWLALCEAPSNQLAAAEEEMGQWGDRENHRMFVRGQKSKTKFKAGSHFWPDIKQTLYVLCQILMIL